MRISLLIFFFCFIFLQGCHNQKAQESTSTQFNSYVNETPERTTKPEKNTIVNIAF